MASITLNGTDVYITNAGAASVDECILTLTLNQRGSGKPSLTNYRPFVPFANPQVITRSNQSGVNHTYQVYLLQNDGVYSGVINVILGTLTIDKKFYTFTGSEEWYRQVNESNGNVRFAILRGNTPFSDIKQITDNNKVGNIIASSCNTVTAGQTWVGSAYGISQQANIAGEISVCLAESQSFSLAEFKAWLASLNTAGTPFQVVYDITTPIVSNLTSIDVQTLLGYNRFVTTTASNMTLVIPEAAQTITVPAGWSAPATAMKGITVTLTWTGDTLPNTPVVVGVDTMTAVTVTKVSDVTFTFVMPAEPVGVTATLKDYAEINVIQSEGGMIYADKTIAYEGDTVTLTLVPDEGNELQNVKVTKDAREVATNKISDLKYSFVVHLI